MLRPTATIELIYTDETGSTSAVIINVPVSTSIAIMDATATALASLIVPMTDASLTKIRYKFKFEVDTPITDAGSNPITICGVFFCECGEDVPMEVIMLPSIKTSLLIHTGPTSEYAIDLTASDVIAFEDGLIAANSCNPFGNVIASIETAYRQSRV